MTRRLRSLTQPLAPALILFAFLACGRRGDAPAIDSAGATDVVLGLSADGQPTDTEGCESADTTGDGRWRCRIGPRLVGTVTPLFGVRDSSGVRALQALVVRYEGALSRVDTVAFDDGAFMNQLEPYDVSTSDLDGDGWADLRLRHHYGIAANEGHYVWRWQPATRSFEFDELLSGETNVNSDGAGCVKTFGSIGHGGQDQVESRYCLTSGEWVEVWHRDQRYDDSTGGTFETISERRADSLVVVHQGPVKE